MKASPKLFRLKLRQETVVKQYLGVCKVWAAVKEFPKVKVFSDDLAGAVLPISVDNKSQCVSDSAEIGGKREGAEITEVRNWVTSRTWYSSGFCSNELVLPIAEQRPLTGHDRDELAVSDGRRIPDFFRNLSFFWLF